MNAASGTVNGNVTMWPCAASAAVPNRWLSWKLPVTARPAAVSTMPDATISPSVARPPSGRESLANGQPFHHSAATASIGRQKVLTGPMISSERCMPGTIPSTAATASTMTSPAAPTQG